MDWQEKRSAAQAQTNCAQGQYYPPTPENGLARKGKEGGILDRLNRQGQAISLLSQTVAELANELNPIVAPDAGTLASGTLPGEPPAMTEVEDQLRNQTASLQMLDVMLRNLLNRIGL